MAYIKTTWETGDVITAEKLNNMEDGIASSVTSSTVTNIVKITESDYESLETKDSSTLYIVIEDPE